MPTTKKSFRVLFYIRNQRENKDGSPIMMRITLNGVQARKSVQRRVPKKHWNNTRGEVKHRFEESHSINMHLEMLRSQAYSAFSKLERAEEHFSAQCVLNLMQGKNDGKLQTFIEVWERHNDELKLLVGKTISHNYWRKHNCVKNHLVRFLILKYKSADLPVSKITGIHIEEFYNYLIHSVPQAHNSAVKNMQYLKKITKLSMQRDWLTKDPFTNFPLTFKSVERPFLTKEELDVLQTTTMPLPRLDLIRDLFVFSCYTGLAYIDVKNLKKEEILQTPDGIWWIKTLREKTKVRSQIPLLQTPIDIIQKHLNLNEVGSGETLFSLLSNQRTNSYLKEIAMLCRINKNLTFHVARHTFATTVTLQNGVPIESVSKMLGHTNIKTTQHYAKVLDSKISQDMVAMSKSMNLPMGTI